MNKNNIVEKIKELTRGYKGKDEPSERLTWLRDLIDSYKRYLPSRVVEKIKVDPSAKKVEGERRTVTVAFADLSGFTALSETMDPEDIADIINNFFTRMMKIVFKYEGSVDKFLGDALMVLFGAPIAHYDDPERAVRAALEMQQEMVEFNAEKKFEQPLSMSIGINTGPAVALNVGSEQRMEYTVIGDTVNLAARLEGVSKAGEIIISHNTFQKIADIVEVEKKPSVKVKGKKKPVLNYLVKVMREHYQLPDITKLKIVGRTQELQIINSCIEEVKKNKSIVLGIVGDPGTGKTRLAFEGLLLAQKNNFTTLNARCMPYEINTPYTTFISLFNDYFKIKKESNEEEKKLLISLKLKNLGLELDNTLPYIGILFGISFAEAKSIPPVELKKRIFEVTKQILNNKAKKSPLFIRIEDLQWTDPTSQELFDYIIKSMDEIPILLLFEYRSDYAFPWLAFKNYKNIALKNFTKQEAQDYSKKLLDVIDIDQNALDAIYDKSVGNPLFVQEILKYLLKKGGIRRLKGKAITTHRFKNLEIAESISGIILDQVDRMSESDRHILQYASVIGKTFKPDLLSETIEIPESDLLQDLERLEHFEGVLTSYPEADEKVYEFLSPTTYEVIYGSLFKTRRRELHSQIGQTLEELFSDRIPEYFEQLAHHFTRSTDERKGVKYSKSAADKSYHLYALKESVNFFQQALYLLRKKELEQKEMQDKLEVLRRQGLVLRLLGNLTQAILNQKRSLRLARKMNSLKDEALTYLNIGAIYQEMGIPKKGLNYWTKTRKIAKKINDKKIQALAMNNLGTYYLHIRNLEKAFENFNEVTKLSEEINDQKGLALANLNRGIVLKEKGDFPKALEYYDRAHMYFEEIDEKENITRCLNEMGLVNLYMGNFDESMKKLNEAVKLASEIGDKMTESHVLSNIGLAYAQIWQLDKAYEKFSQSLVIARITGDTTLKMHLNNNIGDIYQYQGNIAAALEYHLKSIEIAVQIQNPFIEAIVRRSIGWDYFYSADYKKAKEEFEKSQNLFQNIDDRRNSAITLIGSAAVMNNLGFYKQTSQIINSIETKAREINDLEILALVLDIKTELLLCKKEYKNAKEVLDEILDLGRKTGNKRQYAWTLAKMAKVWSIENKYTEAKEHIEKSLSFAQEIGDKLLNTYNLITNAKLSTVASDFTNGLNTLIKVTEQARQYGTKEYLAQGLSMIVQIFKKIGNEQEAQDYLVEYNQIITSIIKDLTKEEKESYLKKIKTFV